MKRKAPEKRLLNRREPRGEEMGVPMLEEGAMTKAEERLLRLMKKKKLSEIPGEEKGIVK